MQSFYLAPGNFDLLLVSGPDSVRFLQGQLTCDVDQLADGSSVPGAACNNKGRVHATFTLIRSGASFFLVLNKGLGALLLRALGKYLPFYKCTMTDISKDWHCTGVAGLEADALLRQLNVTLPGEGKCQLLEQGWICLFSVASSQYFVCCPAGTMLLESLANRLAPGSPTHWQGLGMLEGHFPFVEGDAELYTPQELHLDRHGYVSFTKGCYTGQEIVARMHYRGKPKKELYLIHAGEQVMREDGGALALTTTEGVPVNIIKQTTLPDGSCSCLVLLPIGMTGQTVKRSGHDSDELQLHSF